MGPDEIMLLLLQLHVGSQRVDPFRDGALLTGVVGELMRLFSIQRAHAGRIVVVGAAVNGWRRATRRFQHVVSSRHPITSCQESQPCFGFRRAPTYSFVLGRDGACGGLLAMFSGN